MTLTPNPYESMQHKPNSLDRTIRLGRNLLVILGFAVGSAYAIGGQAKEFVEKAGSNYIDIEYGDKDSI